jgi:transcriptional regulator with XRE-family HTH domain
MKEKGMRRIVLPEWLALLRVRRRELGWSQNELAKACDQMTQVITKLEKGEMPPTRTLLRKVSFVLAMDFSLLSKLVKKQFPLAWTDDFPEESHLQCKARAPWKNQLPRNIPHARNEETRNQLRFLQEQSPEERKTMLGVYYPVYFIEEIAEEKSYQ